MYENINELLNKHTNFYEIELNLLLLSMGEKKNTSGKWVSMIAALAHSALKFAKEKALYDKHYKKRVPTEKWAKTEDEIGMRIVAKQSELFASLSTAHVVQTYILKVLWTIEKNNEGIEISYCDAPSSFSELLKEIQFFDSSDRDDLKIFNRFRNIISHGSIEAVSFNIDKAIANELNELADRIHTLNKMIFDIKRDEMLSVIHNALELIEDGECAS